jgi:FkbH-like protein
MIDSDNQFIIKYYFIISIMINIQRNFFVENILIEAGISKGLNFSKVPYKDYVSNFKNNDLSLIFLDIDRIKNINDLKTDLNNLKKNQGFIILVPISKHRKKLDLLFNYIEKIDNRNLIVINFFKLGLDKVVDVKREKIFKSFLSLDIQLTLAKVIKNILTLLNNNDVRLVSIDLDNTCWSGIIGEEGLKKIFLDSYQKKALNFINRLIAKTGLIVSIHSKNSEKLGLKGINNKLAKYTNIKKKTFKYINWDPKIKSIKKITKVVNFSKNNIVYVDDNISEIKQINKFLLKKNCFWVKNSYIFYLYSKSLYISNFNKEKNIKRFKDIKSNIIRSKVTDEGSVLNYIKNSKLNVQFTIKNLNLKRCEELSNKTNQFNSNYQRYKLTKLKSLTNKKHIKVITFSVSDKYSDSGIISNIVLQKNKLYYKIVEFTMSCRALGRGLECYFLNQLIKKFSIKELIISYIKTDRNEPFIKLAEKISFKKNKNNYWIDIKKTIKIVKSYEKFIKTKIN